MDKRTSKKARMVLGMLLVLTAMFPLATASEASGFDTLVQSVMTHGG